jgi:hypothetical protein
MGDAVPVVPVADDPHGPGARGPHREAGAVDALVRADVGAQHLPQLLVVPLADQVEIERAEGGPERPRLDRGDHAPAAGTAEPVAHRVAAGGQVVGGEPQLEDPRRVDLA